MTAAAHQNGGPTLGVAGVLAALQRWAAVRPGVVAEQVCSMMRQWGEERRVTPQGQVITLEDVEAAIPLFLQSAGTKTLASEPVAAVTAPDTANKGEVAAAEPAPAAPAPAAPAPAVPAPPKPAPEASAPTEAAAVEARPEPLTKRQRTKDIAATAPDAQGSASPAAPAPAAAAAAEAKPEPLTKRQRTKELREQQQREEAAQQAETERLRKERAQPFVGLSVEEMREKRLAEVLSEMDGRLRDIVVRTARALGQEPPGPEVLDRLCGGAPAGEDAFDRRDAYMRAIHTIREVVTLPEGLEAELMPHQIDGLEWLVSVTANGLHGILADEMGLGKTVQTIAWLQWLKEFKGNKGPHLIVAPKSTLTNWEAEFKRFAPSYKAWLVVGTEEERAEFAKKLKKRVKHNKTTTFITNYEQIHRNDWLQDFDWQAIVIDEGHRMKNKNSLLHQTMTKMRCRTKMLLTGTPLQNNMNELWSLLHYLMPELWETPLDFQAWFLDPLSGIDGFNEYEVQLRPEDEQLMISRLHMMLSPFLLQRTKAQVMAQELPPKVESIVRVPLSAWQTTAYKDLEKRTIRLLTGEDKVETQRVNNALMQLRKIVLHPHLFSGCSMESGLELVRASGKVEALDRMLRKLIRFGHKTLVFSQFTSALDVLGAFLQWRGIKYARLDGQTPHEERRRQIHAFSDPTGDLNVFLLSARAGGLGLNLQAADTVVLFDLDWNPQNDKQAIARSHRFGQTREVRVFRLLSDSPVERHMERRCSEKLDLERKIIGAGLFNKGATQEQRADMLKSILGLAAAAGGENGAGGGNGAAESERVIDDATSPEELNRLLARSDEELAAFRAIDEELLRPLEGHEGLDVDAALGGEGGSPRAPSPSARAVMRTLLCAGRLMRRDEVPEGFRVDDDMEAEE